MTEKAFALHETMELHEMLTFKNVCFTKSNTMKTMVSDDQLNSLLQTCAATDKRHIQELQHLLSGARIMTEYQEGVQH
ncbi:hypothetical protein [Alicyclobacillus fodiniaquatilis]|uniref:Spore coat protein n=1 Tax=Alicyclobacillus fodiniaquatilis TaxID=1661150 RepID=A0ABW4JEE6_9BACL